MKKYIIEYEDYDDILSILGHDIPHSNLKYVTTVIVDLYEDEYNAIKEAGVNITENHITSPEKGLLFYPSDKPYRTYPLLTGGLNEYLNITGSHTAGFDGTGVNIGLLDTGCQPANQALCMPSLILQDYTGFGTGDLYSHGSKGCMILAQRYSFFNPVNEVLTGMAIGATVYSMNVFDGGVAAVIDAINYCIGNDIHIINMSFDMSTGLTAAVNAALAAGIIVVCACGNSLLSDIAHPADIPGVIAVNAVETQTPGMPVFGSYTTGDGNVQITTTNYNGGHYEFFTGGTSQAAFQLTGLLAIYKQKYPSLNTEKAIHLLRRKALTMDGYNYNVNSYSRRKFVNYETGGGFVAPIN